MTAASAGVTSVSVDLRRNVLLLHLDRMANGVGPPDADELPALLDVGANGWLLGVEIGEAYFPVADAVPGTEHLTRTCQAQVSLSESGTDIVIPRRGEDYELSFPSGNQCWLRAGQVPGTKPVRVCATVTSVR